MSHLTSQLESDDSSTLTDRASDALKEACVQLRRRAFRATNQLSLANRKTIRKKSVKLLQNLALCTDAIDANFIRVAADGDTQGLAGLRYSARSLLSEDSLKSLAKFQFHLLPSRIQKCLRNDQIAKIRGDSSGGGRLLAPVLRETGCKTYYLCPLHVDGKLKGILGLACRNEVPIEDTSANEFFELLKLNGTILLTNVIRVRKESRRTRKLAEWRRIADQACDFAITIDERFVISETAAFGAGEKTPVLNGLRLTDIIGRTFQRDLLAEIRTAVETSNVRTTNFQIVLDHEGPRWCLARIEPSRRANSEYATLYLTDNTADKLLQEEVRELTDHLAKASRLSLLGQMSTEFAHQLNQPLQAILNYCNMMQRRIERDTATEEGSTAALANIENSVMHAADIIQRIRDFVKFRMLLTEELQISEIIEQAMMMVLPTARGWNVDIVPPEDLLNLEVVVDKAQTTHVLVNLMINAIEACRQFGINQPRIELIVRKDSEQGRVVLAVRDNGPGLPEKDPDVVFQKFYSGKEEGLGMGLAISREVCESQGGNLTAQNNPGKSGCTFFVSMSLKNSNGSDTVELNAIDAPNEPPID